MMHGQTNIKNTQPTACYGEEQEEKDKIKPLKTVPAFCSEGVCTFLV